MNVHLILWVYIILLLAGGLMGFVKAQSKISLIASVSFAALLVLFALDVFPFRYHGAVLVMLLIVFGVRLAKTKKFMPSGLMLVLTAVALGLSYLF
ncbi:MAG: TMEM14 family protein [Chloroflexi bacterium]|nr:TMEM14 family protein [Chloroflexota bacterium]